MAEVLPVAEYQQASVEPIVNRSVNRLRSGAALSGGLAHDYWQGEFVTAPMMRDELGKWNAFLLQHGDAKSSVLIGHPHECRPMAYTTLLGVNVAGGGQFNGVGTVFSITDLTSITVNNLPSNFMLKMGDWIGIEEGGRATLHQVMADATGDAGGSVSLSFLPPMPLQRTTAAQVRFEKPVGEFILGKVNRQKFGTATVLSYSATSRVT
ncbi:hypothetical protein [Maritalea sp.]|uniref:hypothetical protein n=1 Tax=Maritalea sp. TaxID=2003361 RepID=UPI003EF87AE1